MNHDLIEAARAVYADFMPAERSADVAAARTARLLATMLEQRTTAGLPIGTGAPLIRKLTKSLAAQIEAREEFIMAHKLATALRAEMGVQPTQYGDTEDCPPDDPKRIFISGAHDVEHDNVIRLATAG